MTQAAKQIDPRSRDRIERRAGLALFGAAPTNRSLARAIGAREDTSSRWRNARRPNAVSRFLEIVHKLATTSDTTPYPLISEANITALEGRMAGMDKRAMVRRYWALKSEQHEALAAHRRAEIHAAETGDLEPLETAEGAMASAATEAAALIRLLRKHSIDPRDEQWRRS